MPAADERPNHWSTEASFEMKDRLVGKRGAPFIDENPIVIERRHFARARRPGALPRHRAGRQNRLGAVIDDRQLLGVLHNRQGGAGMHRRGRAPPDRRHDGVEREFQTGVGHHLDSDVGDDVPIGLQVEIVKCRVQAKTDRRRVGPEELLIVIRTRDDQGAVKHVFVVCHNRRRTPQREFSKENLESHTGGIRTRGGHGGRVSKPVLDFYDCRRTEFVVRRVIGCSQMLIRTKLAEKTASETIVRTVWVTVPTDS